MGSDFYSYVVIGVKANKYAESKKLTIQKQATSCGVGGKPGQLLFDGKGKPVMQNVSVMYIEFMNKKFRMYVSNKFDQEFIDKKFEKETFADNLESTGLKWFSYDYSNIYPDDLIGIEVQEYGNEGVPISDISGLFSKAVDLLKQIGIDEIPLLYSSFHHSY